jgi:hypothetical protein
MVDYNYDRESKSAPILMQESIFGECLYDPFKM